MKIMALCVSQVTIGVTYVTQVTKGVTYVTKSNGGINNEIK